MSDFKVGDEVYFVVIIDDELNLLNGIIDDIDGKNLKIGLINSLGYRWVDAMHCYRLKVDCIDASINKLFRLLYGLEGMKK